MAQDIIARGLAIEALSGGGGGGDHPVTSVNGKTGAVTLTATDVNALPNTTFIPTKTSDLTNDNNFATNDYVNSVADEIETLVIPLIESAETAGTYSTTIQYAEIKQAYDDGRPLVVTVDTDAKLPLMNAEFSGEDAGFTFGYTQVKLDGESIVTRSIHYLHSNSTDEWADSDTESSPLTLNGGVMDGNINMATHNIINAGKIHIDGQAPLFLGSTIEQSGTAGTRLTGTTAGEAAFVKADTQATYVPVYVGDPTTDSHAANRKYVSNNYLSLTGGTVLGEVVVKPSGSTGIGFNSNGVGSTIFSGDGVDSLNIALVSKTETQPATMQLVDGTGGNVKISGVATPTQNTEAVNKQYVDGKVSGVFAYDEATQTLTITV